MEESRDGAPPRPASCRRKCLKGGSWGMIREQAGNVGPHPMHQAPKPQTESHRRPPSLLSLQNEPDAFPLASRTHCPCCTNTDAVGKETVQVHYNPPLGKKATLPFSQRCLG